MIRLALLLGMLGTQVSALSCLPPDPARSFRAAADVPDRRFTIVAGALTIGQEPDQKSLKRGEAAAPFTARLRGTALGQNGFTHRFDQRITIEQSCIAHWCGSWPESGENKIFIVERLQSGYVFEAGACGGELFENTPANRRTFESCMSGGRCAPAQ